MIIFFIASSIFGASTKASTYFFALPTSSFHFIISRTVYCTVRDEWKEKEERWGDCKYSLFFFFETVMFAIDSLLAAAAARIDDTGIWLPVQKKFSSLFLCRSGPEHWKWTWKKVWFA